MARKKQEIPESTKSNSQSTSRGAIWIILIILVLIALIVIFWQYQKGYVNTSSQDSITGNVVGSNGQNCRDVQTPYEEQEEYLKTEYYTETVPYQEEVPLTYKSSKREGWYGYQCALWNYKLCYDIDITNLDGTNGGIFTVKCSFRTLNNMLYDTQAIYVNTGETNKITCIADISIGEDVEPSYEIIPPTKTVTNYKEVQRERQVTAYRPVTKYRTETKCE